MLIDLMEEKDCDKKRPRVQDIIITLLLNPHGRKYVILNNLRNCILISSILIFFGRRLKLEGCRPIFLITHFIISEKSFRFRTLDCLENPLKKM
jgi:hypothetical protein